MIRKWICVSLVQTLRASDPYHLPMTYKRARLYSGTCITVNGECTSTSRVIWTEWMVWNCADDMQEIWMARTKMKREWCMASQYISNVCRRQWHIAECLRCHCCLHRICRMCARCTNLTSAWSRSPTKGKMKTICEKRLLSISYSISHRQRYAFRYWIWWCLYVSYWAVSDILDVCVMSGRPMIEHKHKYTSRMCFRQRRESHGAWIFPDARDELSNVDDEWTVQRSDNDERIPYMYYIG